MIKHVKRLPKSYGIEIVDIFGQKTVIDGLRLQFSTFDAAEVIQSFIPICTENATNFM